MICCRRTTSMRILLLSRQARFLAIFVAWVFPTIAFVPWRHQQSSKLRGSTTFVFPAVSSTSFINQQSSTGTLCHMTRTTKNSQRKIRRKPWDEMLPRLEKFHQQHGHCRVLNSDDPELDDWVRNLRYNYLYQIRNTTDPALALATSNRKRLSDEKLQLLQALNFSWVTKRQWNRWEVMLERLKDYKDTHGTTHVAKTSEDAELYQWTKNIRYNYRHQALEHITITTTSSYRRPRLSATKMQALEDFGFDWETSQRKVQRWTAMLPRLMAYQKEHGHTNVKASDGDLELYQWTRNLIKNYGPQLLGGDATTASSSTNNNRPRLSQEKLKMLQDMNFAWQQKSTMWDRRYQELRAFSKDYGHCQAPTRDYPQLGNFVQNQRQEYRRYLAGNTTTLTSERVEALQRIPTFTWAKSHELAWEERRGDLQDYMERTGNANVPQEYTDNAQLGLWCMNQRTNYRVKKNAVGAERRGLSTERIRELEELDFQWSFRQAQWLSTLERLKRYEEEHGHLEIETADVRNGDLRQWLNEQRHYHKSTANETSRLTPERVELLESIPSFSWRRRRGKGPSKDDWSDLFVAIREKGIAPGQKAKQHWFDGVNPFEKEVKTEWTEQELLGLWNSENGGDADGDGDEDGDGDGDEYGVGEGDEYEDEDEYFEDEESRLFLRA